MGFGLHVRPPDHTYIHMFFEFEEGLGEGLVGNLTTNLNLIKLM